MNVGEHTQIQAHKLCVSSHSHVRLQILRGLAIRVFHTKLEIHGQIRFERIRRAPPHHAAAIRKLRHRRISCLRGTGGAGPS